MHWWSLLRLLLPGRKKQLATTLVFELIHAIFLSAPIGVTVWIAWILLNLTDSATHSVTDNTQLATQLTTALVVLLISFVCQLLLAPKLLGASSHFSYKLSCSLRLKLGEHFRQLSLGQFGQRNRTLMADELIQAVNRFEFVLSHSLANISAAVFTPLILAGLLFWLQWQLALALFIALACAVVLQGLAGKLTSKLQRHTERREQHLRDRLLEYLQGIQVLQSYGFAGKWRHNLERDIEHAHTRRLRGLMLVAPMQLLPGLLLELGFILMVASGNYLLLTGDMHPGALLAMLLVGYRVYEPIKVLFADYLLLRQSDEQLAIVDTLMHSEVMQQLLPKTHAQGCDITFNNVSFSYNQSKVIDDVSFTLTAGGCYALVGPSGSGKTTLLNLLLRLWDIHSGSITIGGADIRSMAISEHQALLASAFQETWLFDDTIRNNVLYGQKNASTADIEAVLQSSGCNTMASQFSKGLDSRIGEGGKLLSGGQKQLVAIARAMLKNAPIILFDEATAALDPENQYLIQQAIENLPQETTLIIIAHTLRTIEHADQILVIESGRIAQSGKHQQLIRKDGTYATLWQAQEQSKGWNIRKN